MAKHMGHEQRSPGFFRAPALAGGQAEPREGRAAGPDSAQPCNGHKGGRRNLALQAEVQSKPKNSANPAASGTRGNSSQCRFSGSTKILRSETLRLCPASCAPMSPPWVCNMAGLKGHFHTKICPVL